MIVVYILGDNGASAEGTFLGTFNEMINFNGIDVPDETEKEFLKETWTSSARASGASRSLGLAPWRGPECTLAGPRRNPTAMARTPDHTDMDAIANRSIPASCGGCGMVIYVWPGCECGMSARL